MSKHFLINPEKVELPPLPYGYWHKNFEKRILIEPPNWLKHTKGRVVVSVDLEAKNSWKFDDGTEIRYERQVDNFNLRETHPVNATVISGEGMRQGSQILVHHNAPSENNLVTNHSQLSGEQIATSVRVYSIPEDQCFAWLDGDKWKPLPPYETALRVYKPYEGMLVDIEPTQLKNTLYCTSGELKGLVLKTVTAADYCIVFQDTNGKEGQLIRWRPFGDGKGKEEEAIAVLHEETELVKQGKLLIGLDLKDAKPINDYGFFGMDKNINAYAD